MSRRVHVYFYPFEWLRPRKVWCNFVTCYEFGPFQVFVNDF